MRDEKGRFLSGHKQWLGKKRDEATKEKIRKAKLGKPPWNKGLKMSDKYRKKLSDAHKGLPGTWIGRKHSEESKEKIRLAKRGLRGRLSPNWRGGKTKNNKRIRGFSESVMWRNSVFMRDNFTCRKCRKRGCVLVAHHVLNFAEHPLLRTVTENGITLCENCHVKFHKFYGFRKNTVHQIEQFLDIKNNILTGATVK